MSKDIKFSDAKTVELWLPKRVVNAISMTPNEVVAIHIVATKDNQVYYINGVEVYVEKQ